MSVLGDVLQKTYRFTLVYADAYVLPEDYDGTLFEAGCDDALVCTRDGILTLDFDRESASFREAVLSAIEAVESCKLPVQLIRIEPI